MRSSILIWFFVLMFNIVYSRGLKLFQLGSLRVLRLNMSASPKNNNRNKRNEISSSRTEATASLSPSLKKSKSLSEDRESHLRDPLMLFPIIPSRPALKLMSWNVNGLKALVSNNKSILDALINNHKPDFLCLQETKLQSEFVDQYKDIIPGYESFWSCSTDKKGYSGTAVFVNRDTIGISIDKKTSDVHAKTQKKMSNFFQLKTKESTATSSESNLENSMKTVLQGVHFDFENMEKSFAGEGRTITIETDKFYLVACYVPNSGEKLVRLKYRIDEWDPFMRQYLEFLHERKPVILTGDMNVGHLDIDIHNPDAKHIDKQAGLTPAERNSFSTLLSDGKFVDSFRYFYPNARGQFTYWSQRTFARPVNKGLRLDYFICSSNIMPNRISPPSTEDHCGRAETEATVRAEGHLTVVDSYILHNDTVGCSDHCPIVLVLQ